MKKIIKFVVTNRNEMKYLSLLLIVFLPSCLTVDRIQRNCDKFAAVCVTDTQTEIIEVIRDTIIYRDRIIRDTIHGDTVYVEKIIPVPSTLNIPPIFADVEFATSRAWVADSRLRMVLTQKDTVLQRIIENAEKETIKWREKYYNEKQTVVVEKKVIPGIYRAALWVCIGTILTIILLIIVKLKLW